jgi:hypothetical protein
MVYLLCWQYVISTSPPPSFAAFKTFYMHAGATHVLASVITYNVLRYNFNLLESPKKTICFFSSKFKASSFRNMSDMGIVCCIYDLPVKQTIMSLPGNGSCNSVVGIVTGYGLDDCRIEDQVPLGERKFCSSGHPDSIPFNVYWEIFSRGLERRVRNLITRLQQA